MINNKNPNKNKKIDSKSIEYLCFEGGGGKGVAYLGVIKGMEEVFELKPLIETGKLPNERKIKGISGASAGAITAFFLAMGMTSDDIGNELKRFGKTWFGHVSSLKPVLSRPPTIVQTKFKRKPKTNQTVGIFETFFETMSNDVVDTYRTVEDKQRTKQFSIKKPPLFDKLDTILQFFIPDKYKKLFLYKKIFNTPVTLSSTGSDADQYLHSLIAYRGAFSGLKIREYFRDILAKRIRLRSFKVDIDLLDNIKVNADEVTFEDFFNYFGCDLVITGTNVSQHVPKYFSVYSTPNFPVIEAVAISMNLPLLFKPIYVNTKVNNYSDSQYNDSFKGLWVDGGMLNNYPIHAFDKFEKYTYKNFNFLTNTNFQDFKVAANLVNSDNVINNKIVGFRLIDFSEEKEIKEEEIFDSKKYGNIFPFIVDLLATFMYSGGQGQIRSSEEQNKTIYINSDKLEVVNFAPLKQDFKIQSGVVGRDDIENRILDAYKMVKDTIS